MESPSLDKVYSTVSTKKSLYASTLMTAVARDIMFSDCLFFPIKHF